LDLRLHLYRYCRSAFSNKVECFHYLAVAYLRSIMYTIDTYVAIFFVNWLHHQTERMENVNQKLGLNSLQRGLYRCLQDCIGLQKSLLKTAPYVFLVLEDVQKASAEVASIVEPVTETKTTPVATVQTNTSIPTINGSKPLQTGVVTIHTTTTKTKKVDIARIVEETTIKDRKVGVYFNQFAAYQDAINAMKEAAEGAQNAWDKIQPTVQSVIRVVARCMKKDIAIVLQFPCKLDKLSFMAERYCWSDTTTLAYMEFSSYPWSHRSFFDAGWEKLPDGVDFMTDLGYGHLSSNLSSYYYSSGNPNSYYNRQVCDVVKPLLQADLNATKGWMDKLMDEYWMRDIREIWGTAEEIMAPASLMMDPTWVEAKKKVAEALEVIGAAKRELMAKCPYTEVGFVTLYRPTNILTKVLPPVVRAKCAFEELEKRIVQIAKDVSALAGVMSELSSGGTASGSQTK
jgi:hypothetical protein